MEEELILTKDTVKLKTEQLNKLLNLSFRKEGGIVEKGKDGYILTIPDYQRIYSWEEKQVISLLDDLTCYTNKPFHLGSIIFHKKQDQACYSIVDGQQRIVTLSLLLLHLKPDIDISILSETFQSEEAQNYIAYNKWVIKNYCDTNELLKQKLGDILENVQFSVLIIEDGSLDLAYTFFSNQNSRGKSLTDFELLKAHHLRYVHVQEQAEHLASRWDSIILSSGNDDSKDLLRNLFEIYLFRLRKWMRKREWSNNQKFKVKTEFEAAPIIIDIPPFGEQFNFYETIQGGAHFFAYADQFIYKYKIFADTFAYRLLNKYLSDENHWWYRDIVEAFLYAYYLKFNTLYLADALSGIIDLVSNHRFDAGRAHLKSLFKFAGETEIIMMIDQATSPTFFLAELRSKSKLLPTPSGLTGTRFRYKVAIKKIKDNVLLIS